MEILELKIITNEISVGRFSSRLEGTEERLNELEGRVIEITQFEKQKISWKKKKTKLQEPVEL